MQIYYFVGLLFLVAGFIVKGSFVVGYEVCSKEQRRMYIIFAFGIMIMLSAFKDVSVGTDTKHYYSAYHWIVENKSFGRYEQGFGLLCMLVGNFLGDFQYLIILSSLLMFIPFAVYIYYESDDVFLSVFIFYVIYFISLNTMLRQGIAMGIVAIAVMLYKRKRYIWFGILVLLAASFHKSAYIAFVYLLIDKFQYSFCRCAICVVLAYIAGKMDFVRTFLLTLPIESTYLADDGAGGMNAFMLTVIAFVNIALSYVLGLTSQNRWKSVSLEETRGIRLEYWLVCLYSMFSVMTISVPILDRFSSYFMLGFLTLIPNRMSNELDGRRKFLASALLIAMYFLYQTVVFLYRPLWGGVFPYSFGWTV